MSAPVVSVTGKTQARGPAEGKRFVLIAFDRIKGNAIVPGEYVLADASCQRHEPLAISLGSIVSLIELDRGLTTKSLALSHASEVGTTTDDRPDDSGRTRTLIVGGTMDIPLVNLLYEVPTGTELHFVHGSTRKKIVPAKLVIHGR